MREEPSWFGRLMNKMKKSFCFKKEMENKMYEAHYQDKKSRQCQKEIMKALQLPVSDGSENNITPPEEWKSGIRWSDEDEGTSSYHPPPPPPPHGPWDEIISEEQYQYQAQGWP